MSPLPAFPSISKPLTNSTVHKLVRVEEDLMTVFPRESWAKLHLQFIYFGREHCQVSEGGTERIRRVACTVERK